MRVGPGAIISNRYEIIEQIGSGGMSIVYKARDRKLGRIVAIKILRAEYVKDMEFIKRFDIEARSAASLIHANIVNVYDVGHENSLHYIVMEYVDGVTLKELIKEHAPFDNDEILGVAIQIASALGHAHKNNIVHRDIKPQNILVMPKGIIKVADFGIAKASSAKTITVANNAMGSVHYFSPEQAKGGYVSFKSDIYSLGLVIFEMATGKLPFDGDTPVAVAIKQINEELPSIKKFNDNISDRIEKIVSRATEKFASRRYENIEKMENDLKRALANENRINGINPDDNNKKNNDNDDDLDGTENFATIKLNEDDIYKIKKEAGKKNKIEDYEDYDPEIELKQIKKEKIVIRAAFITAGILIFLISFFGYKIFFSHKQVPVPDLVNKSFEEAEEIAKKIGVKIKNSGSEYNNNIEKDKIFAQNYTEGDNLYKGDVIDVKLSLGTKKIYMPDVINKDLFDAYNLLQSFNVKEIYEYSENVPNNIVIKQEPSFNELLEENSEVVLYVSRGKEIKNVYVPNLIGLSEANAKIKLKDLNLVVGNISKSESEKYAEGIVMGQSITGGKEVAEESIVNLIVSSGVKNKKANMSPNNNESNKNNNKNEQKTNMPEKEEKKEEDETKVLIVDPVNIPSDVDKVKIKILKVNADTADNFYESEVEINKLPLKFNIDKNNAGEYQIYIVDSEGNSSYQGSTTISFD